MSTPRGIKDTARRPDIEDDLKEKYHVDWLYLRDVPTDQFDVDKSLANQARFEALDPATVELYKEGVARGDIFPAVLAYRPGRGVRPKLVIIDGNHRLAAHMEAGKTINVYEIDKATHPQTISVMMHAFNTKHGRPTSEEERVRGALYLMDSGAPLATAAETLNVPLKVLRRALTDRLGDTRAVEAGVNLREWESIPKGTRSRLHQISSDEGFAAASHLAYAAKMSFEETAGLVTDVNTTKSANKQKQIVRAKSDEMQERIQADGGGLSTGRSTRKGMTHKVRVSIMLGQILTLPEDNNALVQGYAEPEREEAAQRIEDASQRLHKLARALNPSLR